MSLLFVLIKNKIAYDISGLVETVNWSGRKNSPARSLQLKLMDDPELGDANRTHIDVYKGHWLMMIEDGTELFRGIIMKQSVSENYKMTIIAYDNAIYMVTNKESFSYKKKTLTEVFLDVCNRFGLPRGMTASTTYKIPTLTDIGVTIYDILCNAMSQTYKNTGERYYVISKQGQIHLLRRKEQITKLVFETGDNNGNGNITKYSYSKDISNTKTRLKLISQQGKTIAEWKDMNLEEILGIMQDVQKPDDSLAKSKLKQTAITMLNELKKPAESLTIDVFGVSTIYSGCAVYVSIPVLGISRTFYVDADTHTWDGGYHTMRLTLNYATDLESIGENGGVETDKSEDSSATVRAKQDIKDAAAALKAKKKAESMVVKAGAAADRFATAAEKNIKNMQKALANAEKYSSNAKKVASYMKTVTKQAKTAVTNATKAIAKYEEAKTYLAEAKSLMNLAQAVITTNADYAARQAEIAAERARDCEEEAKPYIS